MPACSRKKLQMFMLDSGNRTPLQKRQEFVRQTRPGAI